MDAISTNFELLKAAALALEFALAPTQTQVTATYILFEKGTGQTLTLSTDTYLATFTSPKSGWHRYTLASSDSSLEGGMTTL